MRYFFPTIILLSLLIQACSRTEKYNPQWLKKDELNLNELITLIHSNERNVDSIISKLKNLDIRETSDTGFNEKRYTCAQYGGYITQWISINAYNNQVYYLSINIDSNDIAVFNKIASKNFDIRSVLSKYLVKVENGSSVEKYFQYEYFNDSIFDEFVLQVEKVLGEIKPYRGEKFKEEYNLLINPTKRYDFGQSCYLPASKPPGRIAIDKLFDANESDLIRNAIRGYNPEGRIYAIEALLKLHEVGKYKITEQDRELIQRVINLNIPINSCQECITTSNVAIEVFKSKDLSELLASCRIESN